MRSSGSILTIVGAERFLIELIRRNDSVVAGLTLAQLFSLALLALGSAILIARRGAPRPAAA